MKTPIMKGLFFITGILMMSAALAVAPDFIEKLNSDARPMEDRARDGVRRPYQVIQLAGVEEGMTVADVISGGGWYVRVLSLAVGEEGTVYSQGLGGRGEPPEDIVAMANVEPVSAVSDIPDASVDVLIFALESHHFVGAAGADMYGQIYDALKPEGLVIVTDHIADADNENFANLHRIPIEVARETITAAGFSIETESNILRNNVDDHSRMIFDPALGRNTDRFLFVARKPSM
jgi:predicted methyltransferase